MLFEENECFVGQNINLKSTLDLSLFKLLFLIVFVNIYV